ncbi:carph-isopro domain-containing protein [Devosia naphthalenivorans]|uniref:carph-isopro domain-containing protein n=1 Tax=Devosia naphthalenivorans TaxID=2082392 RepID=UPI001FE850F1|nr:hypothetical protein [Devosia naphthalenivorans]
MKLEFKSSMTEGMDSTLTLAEIIKKAGGPAAIAEASGGGIKKDAVYKWPSIGVPDRHWQILIERAGVTAEQLYAANLEARGVAA